MCGLPWQAAEALFNFVNAWSVMFGPLLQLDSSQRPQSSPPSRAAAIWSGQVFLTNGTPAYFTTFYQS